MSRPRAVFYFQYSKNFELSFKVFDRQTKKSI
jgi:hypothetical protein